jgi:hypothetical protein
VNPLESVQQFREQQAATSRAVKIAPPPPVPPVGPPPTLEVVADTDLDDAGELDLTGLDHAAAPDGATSTDPGPGEGTGRQRAMKYRKQTLQLYLSAPTRARLEEGRRIHGTYGEATMAALRATYRWLVDHHTPEPVEAVGPFPVPTPTRRRLAVEDARVQQILVTPDEATAIERLADDLQLNLSELTSLAIDKHYGEGGSLPVDPSPTPTKAKR